MLKYYTTTIPLNDLWFVYNKKNYKSKQNLLLTTNSVEELLNNVGITYSVFSFWF